MESSYGFMVKECHFGSIWKEASILPSLFIHSPLKDWEKDPGKYICLSLFFILRPACLQGTCIFLSVLLCTRHKWTCLSKADSKPSSLYSCHQGPVGAGKQFRMCVCFVYTNCLSQTKAQSLNRGCTEESNWRRPQI